MTKVSSLILTGIPTPYMLDQLILDSITYRMSIKRSNHNQYVDCDCMDGKFAMQNPPGPSQSTELILAIEKLFR